MTCQGRPIRSIVANLAPARCVEVVVEDCDSGVREALVERLGRRVGRGVARLEVDQADSEGRDAVRPDDAGIVVARLDDGADEPRDADAVGAACGRMLGAVGAGDLGASSAPNTWCRNRRSGRPRCRGWRGASSSGTSRSKRCRVVHVLGGGVERGPRLDDRREVGVVVDVVAGHRQVEEIARGRKPRSRRSRRG